MILTTRGWMMLEPYGGAINVPKKAIVGAYTALAIAVPVIVPLPLVLILKRALPDKVRYG